MVAGRLADCGCYLAARRGPAPRSSAILVWIRFELVDDCLRQPDGPNSVDDARPFVDDNRTWELATMKLLTLPLIISVTALALPAEAADIKLCKISGVADLAVPVPTSWSLEDCQNFAKRNGGSVAQALCLYENPIGNAIFLAGHIIQFGASSQLASGDDISLMVPAALVVVGILRAELPSHDHETADSDVAVCELRREWIRGLSRDRSRLDVVIAIQFVESQFHRNAIVGFTLPPRTEGGVPLDRCDEYRRFAEACIEFARHQEGPQERAALLQMALIWSRLAEHVAALYGRFPKSLAGFDSTGSTEPGDL